MIKILAQCDRCPMWEAFPAGIDIADAVMSHDLPAGWRRVRVAVPGAIASRDLDLCPQCDDVLSVMEERHAQERRDLIVNAARGPA